MITINAKAFKGRGRDHHCKSTLFRDIVIKGPVQRGGDFSPASKFTICEMDGNELQHKNNACKE